MRDNLVPGCGYMFVGNGRVIPFVDEMSVVLVLEERLRVERVGKFRRVVGEVLGPML